MIFFTPLGSDCKHSVLPARPRKVSIPESKNSMWLLALSHGIDWIWVILGGIVLFFVGLMALMFVGIILASCFETQRVREFVPAKPETVPAPLPYMIVMNDAARGMGFQPGGIFAKMGK